MDFSQFLMVCLIALAAFLVNIPLGRLRKKQPKLSLKWFLYIHLSVPMIIAARHMAELNHWVSPIFVVAALMGQIAGGK